MIRSVIFLLTLIIALTGCSLFGDEDNSEPPAELESFDKQVRLRSLWSRGTGDGTDEQLVKLVPVVVGERIYAADRNGSVWAYELEKARGSGIAKPAWLSLRALVWEKVWYWLAAAKRIW